MGEYEFAKRELRILNPRGKVSIMYERQPRRYEMKQKNDSRPCLGNNF